MSPSAGNPRSSGQSLGLSLGAVALALLISICGFQPTFAATPSSGTLDSGTTYLSWTGGNISGANSDESTCVDGVTCETFTLKLAPGTYPNTRIRVRMDWLLLANDYDLYIHQNTVNGPVVASSGQGTTAFEETFISLADSVVVDTLVYVCNIVAWSVGPGDNYAGEAEIAATANPRTPIYQAGTLTFSENVALKAPIAASDGEPSVRVDIRGNCYVGGIRGVPAGVDLWRFDLDQNSPTFDPGMQNPTYLGQPDAFLQQDPADSTAGGADGGGDIDISVSFPTHPDSIPVVTITSLAAANISSAVSYDRGDNFTLSPAVAIVPADDRQWNESTGESRVYMMYRAPIPATGLFCARSDDSGFTYPITSLVNPSGTTPGYIDVDHSNGNVYISHEGGGLFCATSTDDGLTWKNNLVDNATGHGALFDVVKVGNDGTVYAAWCDQTNIYLSHSTDEGANWATPVQVNDNSVYKTNLFPWLEAGDDGRVVVVWFGTTHTANDDSADWEVLFSQTFNAKDQSPVFNQQVISDHIIHASNISLGGLTGAANRNLIDYFQVALDPQGAAVVAFADDHNDYDGHTYVTRQLDGPSLYANANGTGQVNAVYPPPLPPLAPGEPEVSDFLHDAVTGLLIPINADNAFDILWVDYSCELDSTTQELLVVGTMKVSSLADISGGVNWRMNYATNGYSGLSDRGDQFYMQADATNPSSIAYTWGTGVRTSDGGFTYTQRGNAFSGSLDVAAGTITIKVAVSDMNNFLTVGPVIGPANVYVGLRGQTFTPGANGIRDITRGGTSFHCNSTLSTPNEPARPMAKFMGVPSPNPMQRASSVQFEVDRPGFVELSVFDVQGRRVRSIVADRLPSGSYTETWDGRTDRFSDAPAGVYFFLLNVSSGVYTQKVTLTR